MYGTLTMSTAAFKTMNKEKERIKPRLTVTTAGGDDDSEDKKKSQRKGSPSQNLTNASIWSAAGLSNRSVPHTRISQEADIENYYILGKKLGQGTFGIVYEAKSKKDGTIWAMKAVNKEKAGSSAIFLLEREVSILKKVSHEHIIHLEEVFETAQRMYLVMEFCRHGELAELYERRRRMDENDVRTVVGKLASAMSYLHKNDVMHRDLKLENILIGENPRNPDDHLHIKVTDFGLAILREGLDDMANNFCGTPTYMAPEILDSNKAYSQQCDVWAMGVIMFMLLFGRPPFHASSEEELYELIQRGQVDFGPPADSRSSDKAAAGRGGRAASIETSVDADPEVGESAKTLINGMLTVDPAYRLTASEVLNHPWTKGETDLDSRPSNVLNLMKEWKDELRNESLSMTDLNDDDDADDDVEDDDKGDEETSTVDDQIGDDAPSAADSCRRGDKKALKNGSLVSSTGRSKAATRTAKPKTSLPEQTRTSMLRAKSAKSVPPVPTSTDDASATKRRRPRDSTLQKAIKQISHLSLKIPNLTVEEPRRATTTAAAAAVGVVAVAAATGATTTPTSGDEFVQDDDAFPENFGMLGMLNLTPRSKRRASVDAQKLGTSTGRGAKNARGKARRKTDGDA